MVSVTASSTVFVLLKYLWHFFVLKVRKRVFQCYHSPNHKTSSCSSNFDCSRNWTIVATFPSHLAWWIDTKFHSCHRIQNCLDNIHLLPYLQRCSWNLSYRQLRYGARSSKYNLGSSLLSEKHCRLGFFCLVRICFMYDQEACKRNIFYSRTELCRM